MSTTHTTRTLATARVLTECWLDAYALWESGQGCSPSANDLAEDAFAIWTLANGYRAEAHRTDDTLADWLFERLSEGIELADLALSTIERLDGQS